MVIWYVLCGGYIEGDDYMKSRPNIFDYATSELSQDAFLAWYCRWADETMTDDMELHASACAFLKKYIAMQQPDYNEDIQTVIVSPQHKHIDVFLTINGNLSVIIEDKIHTFKHDNQLIRYSDAVEGRKVKLYIKTGDESLKHKKEIKTNDGYSVIYRDELLESLEKCKSKSEIFVSFVERLRRKEDETRTYRESNVWKTAQVIGFYKDMERVLPNSNWGHVDNAAKGSYVLNWSWLHLPECRIYLEFSFPCWCAAKEKPYLEYFKLLVKITADKEPDDERGKHDLRLRLVYQHANAFERHTNGLMHRPAKLRTGRYMTISEIECEQFIKDSASIDIHQIKEQLRPYEEAVRTYAEMMKCEA